MSFLHPTRLTFFGRFQADISTVNNDVRHFDNKTFLPRFQDLQSRSELNGWFNPNGSGAFRLVDCHVTSASFADGRVARTAAEDAVLGMSIRSSDDSVAGKLVDIDPQWQLASAIFGAQVRLVSSDGEELMGSDYAPEPFRDLWFGRDNGMGGDGGASSIFQSVLRDVRWGEGADESPWLKELRETCGDGPLSIRLMTLGYEGSIAAPDFTLGWVSGVIGPAFPDEPRSAVLGRRMVVDGGTVNEQATGKPANVFGLSFFDCEVVEDTLLADFSNALATQLGHGSKAKDPLASDAFPSAPFQELGDLTLAVLQSEDIQEGSTVSPSEFRALGGVPYQDPRWLEKTGGVLSIDLSEEDARLVAIRPLAVLRNQGAAGAVVVMRESEDCWNVRVDGFVQRVQPHSDSEAVRVFAAQYGVPMPNIEIEFELSPPQAGLGGSGQAQPAVPSAPAAPIPVINTPAEAVSVPEDAVTNDQGWAELRIGARDPGHARGYIDSQLYLVNYAIKGHPVAQQMFDVAVFLVFSDYRAPEKPEWEDVKPILTQYANLYPIMSKYLVNLADKDDVTKHAKVIQFAMSRGMEDPNYMPATRDLSDSRRAMILDWLSQQSHVPLPERDGSSHLQGSQRASIALEDAPTESRGGKTAFFESLLKSRSLPSS